MLENPESMGEERDGTEVTPDAQSDAESVLEHLETTSEARPSDSDVAISASVVQALTEVPPVDEEKMKQLSVSLAIKAREDIPTSDAKLASIAASIYKALRALVPTRGTDPRTAA